MKHILFVYDDNDIRPFLNRYKYIFENNIVTIATQNKNTRSQLDKVVNVNYFKRLPSLPYGLFGIMRKINLSTEEQNLLVLAIKNNIVRDCSRLVEKDYKKFLLFYSAEIVYIQKYIRKNNITDLIVTDTIYTPAICYALASLRENIRIHLRTAPYTKDYSNAFKEVGGICELYEHPWQLKKLQVMELLKDVSSFDGHERLVSFDCLVIACHRLNDMNLLNKGDWFEDYADWLQKVLFTARSVDFQKPIFVRPHPSENDKNTIYEITEKFADLKIKFDESQGGQCPFSYPKNTLFLTIRGTIFTEALSNGVRCLTTSRTRYSVFGSAIFGRYSEAMSLLELGDLLKSGNLMSVSTKRQELAKAIILRERDGLNLEFDS